MMNEFPIDLNDDFARALLDGTAVSTPAEPRVFYNEDGDCLEFLFSDEGYRMERVDNLVTIYHGRDTGEVVGALIKRVRNFIQKIVEENPGFVIEIEDCGEPRLSCLFTAGMWKQGDPVIGRKYKRLRDVAASADLRFKMPEYA